MDEPLWRASAIARLRKRPEKPGMDGCVRRRTVDGRAGVGGDVYTNFAPPPPESGVSSALCSTLGMGFSFFSRRLVGEGGEIVYSPLQPAIDHRDSPLAAGIHPRGHLGFSVFSFFFEKDCVWSPLLGGNGIDCGTLGNRNRRS